MCSVAGCTSLAQRFRLPRDPEMRLEWVQFLATANEQQFKESSWRDFRVCCKHFAEDCFENLIPSRVEASGKVRFTLKPDAVPSLCVKLDSGQSKEQVSAPGYLRDDNHCFCLFVCLAKCFLVVCKKLTSDYVHCMHN